MWLSPSPMHRMGQRYKYFFCMVNDLTLGCMFFTFCLYCLFNSSYWKEQNTSARFTWENTQISVDAKIYPQSSKLKSAFQFYVTLTFSPFTPRNVNWFEQNNDPLQGMCRCHLRIDHCTVSVWESKWRIFVL